MRPEPDVQKGRLGPMPFIPGVWRSVQRPLKVFTSNISAMQPEGTTLEMKGVEKDPELGLVWGYVFACELPAGKRGVMPKPTAAFCFASNSSQLPREEQAADAQDTEAAEQYKHAVAGPTDVWPDEPVMNYIKQGSTAADALGHEKLKIMRCARVYRWVDDKLYRMMPRKEGREVPYPSKREDLIINIMCLDLLLEAAPRATGCGRDAFHDVVNVADLKATRARQKAEPGPLLRGRPVRIFRDAVARRRIQELQTFQGRTVAYKEQHGRRSTTKLGVVHYEGAHAVSSASELFSGMAAMFFSAQRKSGIALCLSHRRRGGPRLEQLQLEWEQGLESSLGMGHIQQEEISCGLRSRQME